MERTLVLLKPDAIQKNVCVEILERISSHYSITKLKIMRMDKKMAEEHYAHLAHLVNFNEIIEFMISDKMVAMIVEGENVIQGLRQMIGSTFNAPKGTIRGDYGASSYKTLVHASDSEENAEKEIRCFHLNSEKQWNRQAPNDKLADALSETQKLLEILRLGKPRDGKICLQYDRNKKIIDEYEEAKNEPLMAQSGK